MSTPVGVGSVMLLQAEGRQGWCMELFLNNHEYDTKTQQDHHGSPAFTSTCSQHSYKLDQVISYSLPKDRIGHIVMRHSK